MNTNRVNDLMEIMNSFRKDKYHKSELLTELFSLQHEIVNLTFNVDHASTANFKIWDVERHLEQLNAECGYVANEELQKFIEGSKVLCNLIKAEISGNRGEFKAFRALEYLCSQNNVLKNVELSDGNHRTELDVVVVTPNCITIVEVKNTAKDVFIDQNGNYYRTGEFLKWDCNIAEKMMIKENLLRKSLADVGISNLIVQSIVVFTNNRIEVQNKYDQITTCFLSQLAYIIDGFKGEQLYSTEEINMISTTIEAAECKVSYPIEFDVQQYKYNFATVMATLEGASNVKEEVVRESTLEAEKVVVHTEKKTSFADEMRTIFTSKYVRYIGSVAAAAAISLVSVTITVNTINKRSSKYEG
ncbi:nuclease-related domain-containing protein [Anaerobium acetethylicum]|uniref:Nuclease-related domain-containing protein n=1 Tax=Anaerobium acetethylicum TaxID=1619234 RepID=A0A1D3TXS2_9FIRM|nr:nuclease-related domain-containing protein [Anaerobium acetethylicum]SCP99148.1 Nuclease-related domain-containing protein [Anaerobium acetethylicum]